MRTKYITLFFLLIPILAFSGGNFPLFRQLQDKLAHYLKIRNEETVYIQTDKPFYANGEDIWLTAFVVDASTHKKTKISGVVYVELKDPKGNIVDQLKIAVHNGVAKGDFRLKANGVGGIYTLVAYSQWMRNFGEDRFFKKEIQVQKVITPNLLLRPDFEKRAYGPSDLVVLTLKITDLENQPAVNAKVVSSVSVDGESVNIPDYYSNDQGEARIEFRLPHKIKNADGTINMKVTYNGVNESVFRTIPIVLNKISLAFYPEGGNLIRGFNSRVAFEAQNEHGKGADISGEVIDEKGQRIATFSSFHYGMGAFQLTPEADKRYYARIIRPVGNDSLFALPQVSTGYAMNLSKQRNTETEWNIYSPQNEDAGIAVQVHGVMHYSSTINLKKGVNVVKIPTVDLPAGISAVTLFDSKSVEQCERLIFVNNNKVLNISVEPDQKFYNPRENVKLKIKTTDEKGNPTRARLALSVVDDRLLTFADDKQDNILSYLLLSSELKGKIDEPSFYFNPKEKKAKEAIDYLLLTHGWRRFTWKDVKSEIKKMSFLPENNNMIAGFVTNRKGNPQKSKVTLIETSGKKRIETVNTAGEGQFVFHNVDPTASLMLMTEYPHQVNIWKAPAAEKERLDKKSDVDAAPVRISGSKGEAPKTTESGRRVQYEDGETTESTYISGNSSGRRGGGGGALSEVVVIAYGVVKKEGLYRPNVMTFNSNMEVENLLTGQLANIYIPTPNANVDVPYISPQDRAALYNANNKMLVVIDGVPQNTRINNNFTLAGSFDMDEISSIHVLSSQDAIYKYGVQAANGVIDIQTKTESDFQGKRRPVFKKPKYNGIKLEAISDYYRAREFYIPAHKSNSEERTDFRTTVFWSGEIVTDVQGLAEVSFPNNDANSAFKVTAEGITTDGLIGRTETNYSTIMPLSLDVRLPYYMNFEDLIHIPVSVKNTTAEIQNGNIRLNVDTAFQIIGKTDTTIVIQPGQTQTVYYTLASKGKEGVYPIEAVLSGACNDKVKRTLSVYNIGFPKIVSISGTEADEVIFDYSDVVPGTLRAEAAMNSNIFKDLAEGVQSIIARPYGCFEQVSSSNYPNILALQCLKSTKNKDTKLEDKLKMYLSEGYSKLCSYEIQGGGFDWFGRPPAHTTLSAYGLIQFHELRDVFEGVNIDMMNRTHDFLMNQRKGDGTFMQHRGKYGFQAASENINNAYITYVLAEVGTKNIMPEYTHALEEALESNDMYRMALMANAAYSMGKKDDYKKLVDIFISAIEKGFGNLKAEGSIVYSKTARLEAVAHWANALMKSSKEYNSVIYSCISYISSYRKQGGFGSTQATAICLKALSKYAQSYKFDTEASGVTVRLNNGVDSLKYNSESSSIAQPFFERNVQKGRNVLTTKVNTKEGQAYPYSVNLRWTVKTPEKDPNCPLSLTAKLSQDVIQLNETVRLTLKLRNIDKSGQPMSMIEVGIPAGLSLQPIQMKELRDKGVFDFYEILNNRLILYYRELAPQEEKVVNIDLKADIPGIYIGASSSAYLYYNQDVRYWLKGEKIEIKK